MKQDPGVPVIDTLAAIVGGKFVASSPRHMRRFIRGFRYGEGSALAVVFPASLVELWEVLEACVAAGIIVIPQAANTGLTGGSTPDGSDYDRDVVVVNTMRIKALHILGDGAQIVAFPGTTLDELEKALDPLGREPHSVIGSSCLGASVVGGICNNSGGSLIQRGPAYTEMSLYANVTDDGTLELVNHLDIELGSNPKEMLARLDAGTYAPGDVVWNSGRKASDNDYIDHVRDIQADTPARFNADTRRLYEAAGSAGKVMVFAVRLDTFQKSTNSAVFYIGTNETRELTEIRKGLLASNIPLPIAAEYLHRDAFEIAEIYGKDTYLLIKLLGTRRLPKVFEIKNRIDAFSERLAFLPENLSDRLLQCVSRILPSHLPKRLKDYQARFEHHLILKVGADALDGTRRFLSTRFPSSDGAFFECSKQEGDAAFLHRFATAGAAVRYRAVNRKTTGGIVALDIALPRNETEWREVLPESLSDRVVKSLYYGHFFCHVFHQDYLIKQGVDWLETEHAILAELDKRGARYPAEHNVGHLYRAEEAVADHYRQLDPCNCLNPGIGQTSKCFRWR